MSFPDLSNAVQAEIAHARKVEKEVHLLPAAETRKLGLSLFPLNLHEVEESSNGTVLYFKTSFPINDTYFRKGGTVELISEGITGIGRIFDLQLQAITVFTSIETEVNFRDQQFSLRYIQDDRTFKCMELGAKLALEHPQLQRFQIAMLEKTPEMELLQIEGLNENQQKAATSVLSSYPTTCIQGPPGTGKSHLLAQCISILVKEKKRVIITAPSNTAVDHLAKKVAAFGIPVLRVGNEEKMDPEMRNLTLDAYLENGGQAKVILHLEKSMRNAQQIADRTVRNYTSEAANERRQARKELKELRAEIRTIKRTSEQALLQSIPVIAGTPVGIFNALSKETVLDYVIMDEAGQSLNPLTWLVASFGQKLVLCGDPQQLPPTVLSQEAKKLGLAMSLLESAHSLGNTFLLNTQYRMAPEILAAINPYFYDNQLQTIPEIEQGTLNFIDMAGFGTGEQLDNTTGSVSNTDEAQFIHAFVKQKNFSANNTVILSPYSAQLGQLQKLFGPQWRIATIDSIQGQEYDNILISLTRSNEDGIIGFLKDYRRTNVAISRAKKQCFIIGDSATLGTDSFYAQLIEFTENQNGYKSAWEFSFD